MCSPGEMEEESTECVEGKEGLENDATDEGVECFRDGEEEEEEDNEAQQEQQEEGNDDGKIWTVFHIYKCSTV